MDYDIPKMDTVPTSRQMILVTGSIAARPVRRARHWRAATQPPAQPRWPMPYVDDPWCEVPSPHGPFGARGIGEPPITAGAAALANAVRDATGVQCYLYALTC